MILEHRIYASANSNRRRASCFRVVRLTGRPAVVNSYLIRLIWLISSHTWWENFNETSHKYSSCKWALLKTFSRSWRSEVRLTETFAGGGIPIDGWLWLLKIILLCRQRYNRLPVATVSEITYDVIEFDINILTVLASRPLSITNRSKIDISA